MERAFFGIEQRDYDDILERTRDIWSQLRDANIFITGGTGFFGKWLVGALLWANRRHGCRVRLTLLSRDPEAFGAASPDVTNDAALTIIRGDVASFVFPNGSFSHVIHAATDTNISAHARRAEHVAAIASGTARVLAFAAQSGVSEMLFTSSGAVYGEQPATLDRIPESYNGAPLTTDLRNVYGATKRYAETLCAVEAEDRSFRAKIARCFAFVGPHLPLDGHFAIGNFIRDATGGATQIDIQGDGTPARSYLYAADLSAWLWTMLVRAPASVPLNVGSDAAISIRELAELTVATLSPGKTVHCAQPANSVVNRSRYVPSIDLAREKLGLDVWTPLPEAIRRTAAWHARTLAERA